MNCETGKQLASESQPGPRGFVTCHVCYRKVSRRSLMFHEPKCLERSKAHIDGLLRNKREGALRKAKIKENVGACREPPNLVPCYVCQRKVSRHSMEFHESKCLLRWQAHNNLLPEDEREEPPRKETSYHTKLQNESKECLQTKNKTTLSEALMATAKQSAEHLSGTFILQTGDTMERPRTQTLTQASEEVIRPVIGLEKGRSSAEILHVDSNKYTDPANEAISEAEKNAKSSEVFPDFPLERRNDMHTHENLSNNLTKLDNSYNLSSSFEESETIKDISAGDTVEDYHTNSTLNIPLNRNKSLMTRNKLSKATFPLKEDTSNIPKFITCYICDKQFATRSFLVHEPRCIERWNLKNSSLPLQERRPTPKRCLSSNECFRCSKCSKVFPPERFLIHRGICNLSGSLMELNGIDCAKKSRSETRSLRCVILICRVCGRHFGSESIKIHEPQCRKKWEESKAIYPVQMEKSQKERIVAKKDVFADPESLTDESKKKIDAIA